MLPSKQGDPAIFTRYIGRHVFVTKRCYNKDWIGQIFFVHGDAGVDSTGDQLLYATNKEGKRRNVRVKSVDLIDEDNESYFRILRKEKE